MAFVYIFFILIASFILIKSAQWVIKALTYLAQYFHIPEFVVAFILAGIATSLPELFVGISAAINKTPILSLSNLLGSNIANLTLILGISIVLTKGINTETKASQKNIIYTFLILIYPILLAMDGNISRIDGFALLIIFILYNLILFYQSKNFSKKFEGAKKKYLIKNIFLFILGIILLLACSEIIVRSSNLLASELKIPLFLVGLFLVAIGTSLPELVFNIKAANNQHKDMILGNILGSLVVNSTAILGITAIIYPIIIKDTSLLAGSAVFLVISYLIFIIFSKTKKRISWQEGFILFFLYLTFIIIQFLLK